MAIEEEEVPWYYDVMKFLELGAYLDGANKRERHSIRMMATQYVLCGGQLYRRSYYSVHLRCLKKEDAERVMEEVHQGNLWPSNEWKNVSQEDFKDRLLLEYD